MKAVIKGISVFLVTVKYVKNTQKHNAIFCYVIILLFMLSSCADSGSYMFYEGPVMPLTSTSETDIEVKRNVNFDFAAYDNIEHIDFIKNGYAVITDSYELINPNDSVASIELAYGFNGQFVDSKDQIPLVRVDERIVAPTLYATVDEKSIINGAISWDAYNKVMQEHDYLTEAMTSPVSETTPITVYHLFDIELDPEHPAGDIFIDVGYDREKNTVVWARDYDVFFSKTKQHQEHLFVNISKGDVWIYVIGDELSNINVGANIGYELSEKSFLDGLTYNIETYPSTLELAIGDYAREYDFWVTNNDGYENAGILTNELLIDGALKRLTCTDKYHNTNEVHRLAELFESTVINERMLYWVFTIEVKPQSSTIITFTYQHEASEGSVKNQSGFDIATTLNSTLNITEQTVSVSNCESIRIVNQNLGLDLDAGVLSISVDPNIDRYYLDISPK